MTAPSFFDVVVRQLSSQLFHGGHLLTSSPRTIRAVLGDNEWGHPMWPERIDSDTGEVVRFERFEDFVVTPPTKGLGTTLEMLFAICRDDSQATDMLDQATQRPHGTNQFTAKEITNRNLLPTPAPESRQGTLRALRKNAPELHEKVIAGEMTVAQAAKAAGIRRKRLAIRLDDPVSAAGTITRNASAAFVAELVVLLSHKDQGTEEP